jgi:hypothetical protein
MANTTSESEELFVSAAEIDGRTYNVTAHVLFDGIEYIGHLWFSDAEWDDDEGVRDHGPLAGQSPNEIVQRAQSLSSSELAARYRRALAQRRRYHGLRQITKDVLSQICHLNQVATSMRAGLLDLEEAAGEIDQTERRLHEMVSQLRLYAGVAT